MFTPEQQAKIIEALVAVGAGRMCRCGTTGYTLLDGLFLNILGDGKNMSLGGIAIPTVVIVCSKCGAVHQHAVGTLGLRKELGLE
jgi:hypothetical protein